MNTNTERIFAVADELDANGQSPTLAGVRKALGGGSYTTISQAMTEWKARKAAKEAPTREAPPQAIADMFAGMAGEVWAMALTLSHERLRSEREALEQAREHLEAERQEAAELADQVSAELEQTKRDREQAGIALSTAQTTIATQERTIADLRQEGAVSMARLEEVQKRADQLHTELERVTLQNNELLQSLTVVAKGEKK